MKDFARKNEKGVLMRGLILFWKVNSPLKSITHMFFDTQITDMLMYVV